MNKKIPLLVAMCLVHSGFGASAVSENIENSYDQYDLVIIAPQNFADELHG